MARKKKTDIPSLADKVVDQDVSKKKKTSKIVSPEENAKTEIKELCYSDLVATGDVPTKEIPAKIEVVNHPDLTNKDDNEMWWYPGALLLLGIAIVGLTLWAGMETMSYYSMFPPD